MANSHLLTTTWLLDCKTVVFGRFRKAGSALSVTLECEAREPHLSPFSLAVFTLAPDLSFEYGPSLAFAKIRLFCSLFDYFHTNSLSLPWHFNLNNELWSIIARKKGEKKGKNARTYITVAKWQTGKTDMLDRGYLGDPQSWSVQKAFTDICVAAQSKGFSKFEHAQKTRTSGA